jgi:Rrf2 family protein
MSSLVKISEAASLALHTGVYLAAHPGRTVSVHEVAQVLGCSENHLSKVLQRLVRTGLVHSTRGPGGGFVMAKKPEEVSLLAVYEAIEGRLEDASCLLAHPVCGGDCILGGLLAEVNTKARQYLTTKTLADFAAQFKGDCHDCKSCK